MARKKDAEEDFASKAILDQLQTKTVGAPPSTTGLTGDQLPETIFDVADFDQVKNQVTLQLSNLELLNVLNTVGQITNTQSQSGPIPKQAKVIDTVLTTSNLDATIFNPPAGQVWIVMGVGLAMTSGVQSGTAYLKVEDKVNSTSAIIAEMGTSGSIEAFDDNFSGPYFIDENINLIARYFKSGGFPTGDQVTYSTFLTRVR